MGISSKRIAWYVAFLGALSVAGCGGGDSKSRATSASTVAPATSGMPGTPGTPGGGVANPNSSTTAPSTPGLGPELAQVRYLDVDGDERVSKGDEVVCAFGADLEPVPANLDPAVEFTLAVANDSFGVGATIVAGSAANEVAIVLGADPVLYVSPSFDPAEVGAGAASGLNLSATASGSIFGKAAGVVRPAAATLDLDGALQAGFVAGANLNEARGGHCAVTLDDGRILVIGGMGANNELVAQAELYDPLTESFTLVTQLSGDKGKLRRGKVDVRFVLASATKLKDGKVLVCGGWGVERKSFFGLGKEKVDTLESAFLFDPKDDTFTRVGDMKYPRHAHTATLLEDGKVLIAGGYNESFWRSDKTQAPFEYFDPADNEFHKGGSFFRRFKAQDPRMSHTATSFDGGKVVLLAGGAHYEGGGLFGLIKPKLKMNAKAEAVSNNSSAAAPGLTTPRLSHAAALVSSDQVLFAGGHDVTTGTVSSVELFDAANGTFTTVGSLSTPRSGCEIGFDRDGNALIVGGHAGYGETRTVEVYDPATQAMASTRYQLASARNGCTVNQLTDGTLVVIGGLIGSTKSYLSLDGQALSSCEVFVSH